MAVLQSIQRHLVQKLQLDPEQLQPDSQLAQLGMDSLQVVEFMFGIEDEFKIRIPDGRLEVRTIRDVASVIERLVQEQGKA